MNAGGDTDITSPEQRTPPRGSARIPTLLMLAPIGATAGPTPSRVPLADGELTIGRGEPGLGREGVGGARLGLRDELLSRVHLRIASVPGGYEVEDAGSLNGSYLDGQRLAGRRRLSDGAVLCFGAHAAVFRRLSSSEQAALDEEAAAPFGPVPSIAPALSLTLAKLRRLARSTASLLLVGETGVGKEVHARAIHAASGRKGAFVAVNCAALPAELVESELYGFARGAHSTATASKPGLVEAADGGTLLLDEIGDMAARLQAKVLRFLQEREVMPLGGARARPVDVRIIAATASAGGDGTREALRSDLLARLGAEPIELPPLRARVEDVGALANHLARGRIRSLEPSALRALVLHGWPLNVRELAAAVEHAIALADDGVVRLEHLPAAVRGALDRGPLVTGRRPSRAAPPRAELAELLRTHHGNVASVARTLDRKWNTVWRWLVRHELQPDRFRR